MNNCPKCGFPVTLDETECSNCGEPVENTDTLDVSPENEEEQIVDTPDTIDMDEEDEAEITTIGLDDESEIEDVSEIIPVAELNSVEETESLSEDESEMVEELEPVIEPTPVVPDSLPEEEVIAEAVEENAIPEEVSEVTAVETETPVELTSVESSPSELPIAATPLEVPTVEEPSIFSTDLTPLESESTSSELPVTPIDLPVAETPSVDLAVAVPPVIPEGMPTSLEAMAMPVDNNLGVQPEAPGGIPAQPIPEPVKEEDPELKALKFKKITFIIVIIMSIIILALTAFFMNKIIVNGKGTGENKINESAKEYHYEGFNLYIEDDYYAEIYEGELYVGDKDSKWSAVMTLQTGTYNTLLSNKSQLIDYFKQMGYETTEPVEKEISGTAFVKMEVMMGTKNVLVAYAKANGTKLFGIVLENEEGDYSNDDCLKPIGNILSTMKYTGPTYSLPEGFQLDSFIETFNVAE